MRFRALFFTLLLLPVATPAAADELHERLDAWARALGGRNALEEPRVLELRHAGTMFGMDAQLTEHIARDGRYRGELVLGDEVFRFLMVHDGNDAWQRDQNGKVAAVMGNDIEDLITTIYVARWELLRRSGRPAQVELLGEPDAEGRPRVRCVPEGGEPVTFALDPASGLPVAWERPEQDRVQLTTIETWERREGLLFPSRWSQSTGDPQYDSSFQLVAVQQHEELDPGWFQRPVETADDVVWEHPSPLRDLPLELNTTHILLQASVNESPPLWFILDTGASVTVLDLTAASELGLAFEGNIEGRGSGEGSVEAHLIPGVDFALPGVQLLRQTVAAIDLRPFEGIMGHEIDGILGYDFISRFVVEIDYQGRRLHLHDPDGWSYEGSGAVTSFHFEGSAPYVEAILAQHGHSPVAGNFLVDTGAGGSVHLSRPFTEENGLLDSLERSYQDAAGRGVGGRSVSTVGRMAELRLGGLRFPGPVCDFSQDEGGAHADPGRSGLIGGEVLSRCRLILDYERSRMILEPTAVLLDPFPTDCLGLSLTTRGREDFHHFTIRELVTGGPAERAGLRVGDRILSFDGIPAAELSMHRLWELSRNGERTVTIEIERDGQRMALAVEMEPMV